MEFTISNENYKKLKELSKVCSPYKAADNMYIMRAFEDKLYAIIYENGTIVKFSVDIAKVTDPGYFYIDMGKFLQAMENVFLSSKENEAIIVVDTKLTAVSGKSKVSFPLLDDAPTEEECIEADEAFDKRKEYLFSEDTTTVKITDAVTSFANVMKKYITIFENSGGVSGIAVEHDELKYTDQSLSIFKERLPESISDKLEIIPVSLFPILTTLAKVKSFDLVYSNDDKFTMIEMPELGGLSIISALPLAICEFPTEEEYAYLAPDPENKITFDVDKAELYTKIDAFDGIFSSSSWRWKSVDFTINSDDKETVNLSHTSATGLVEVDLKIKNLVSNTDDDAKFKISVSILYDFLKSFSGDSETVHFEFTNIDPDPEIANSCGIEVASGDCKFWLGKVVQEESLSL